MINEMFRGIVDAQNSASDLESPLMQISDLFPGVRGILKLENELPTGSFKGRGARNALIDLLLNKPGIVTASSGNFGTALAAFAKEYGIVAHIVVPEHTPKVKIDKIKSFGATVHFCGPLPSDRTEKVSELHESLELYKIHSSYSPSVIMGQGTMALEILDQLMDCDRIIVPVSGGGLITGVILAAKELNPSIDVIGVEPEHLRDGKISLETGKLVTIAGTSVAEGLLTPLGDINLEILRRFDAQIVTVTDAEIAFVTLQLKHLGLTIEPSGAATLAAVIFGKVPVTEKTVVVATGGNIDEARYREIALQFPTNETFFEIYSNIWGECIPMSRNHQTSQK